MLEAVALIKNNLEIFGNVVEMAKITMLCCLTVQLVYVEKKLL